MGWTVKRRTGGVMKWLRRSSSSSSSMGYQPTLTDWPACVLLYCSFIACTGAARVCTQNEHGTYVLAAGSGHGMDSKQPCFACEGRGCSALQGGGKGCA
jgi:hypothetical protein